MSETKHSEKMRREYDFSGGVRGKHAEPLRAGHTTIITRPDGSKIVRERLPIFLEPDIQAKFPDSQAVNNALRSLISAETPLA